MVISSDTSLNELMRFFLYVGCYIKFHFRIFSFDNNKLYIECTVSILKIHYIKTHCNNNACKLN